MIEIAGLGLATISVIAGVGTLINFLGVPGLTAAGITSALAAIGSLVGMGMLAGVIILPLAA
jgi:hypothetical protein